MDKHIRLLMEQRNMSGVELAKKLKRTPASVSFLINGKRPLTDDIVYEILLKAFNYNSDEALKQIAEWRMEEYAQKAGLELPEGAILMADNFEYVPLLAKVSCGDGIDMDAIMKDGEHEALIPVPKEYISDKKRTFAFTASGDSMSPEIQNDDTVIVEYSKELSTTKIHLIKYGNEFMFGRIVKTAQGLEVDKTNRTYPPIRIPAGSDFEVCGVVKAVLNLRVY